ncbi:BTB domain-containing protein [Mycena chlorophos]|uniref:BTB domain-containing protein n=1 Tax=Mycena chlorophos TaxID=658473 RepID=A0A8H6SJU5_MYCCL|nr:BTB domain-containing protein [Mycena chlorophos]
MTTTGRRRTEPLDAGFPFGPNSHEQNPPDIIIRSSDLLDFYAHKQILSFGSPFFRHMLAFPEPTGQNANPTKNGLSIVALPEKSGTLGPALSLLYPRQVQPAEIVGGMSPVEIKLDTFESIYEACRKYDVAGYHDILVTTLAEPRFLEDDAHLVFVIACNLRLHPIACNAAIRTLKSPITDRPSPYLRSAPGNTFWQLQDFKYAVARELKMLLKTYAAGAPVSDMGPEYDHVWWAPNGHAEFCGPSEPDRDDAYAEVEPAAWFQDHIGRIEDVCFLRPDPEHIARCLVELHGPQLADISECRMCMDDAAENLTQLSGWFEKTANKRIKALASSYTFGCL